MLPASLCAKIMVFRRITRIIEVVLNERAVMAMNNFMVSMNVFSKGLCIFTTDLRADRHSDWYYIRSVSLAIIR